MLGEINIDGSVDRVTSAEVDGWAYREDDPSEHLTITVQFRGTEIGSSKANAFRPDLREGNIGDGDHAYFIKLEQPLDEEQLDEIVVLASTRDGHRVNLALPAEIDEELDEAVADPTGQEVTSELEAPIGTAAPPDYGVVYAESAPLLAPVCYPVDLLEEDVLAESISGIVVDPVELRDRVRRDVFAIPHPTNREGYAEGNDLAYWLSGYADYRTIEAMAAAHGVTEGRYFDFGGSTGRVFRHFAVQTDAWDVWSCDFKISSVEFNLKYFPKTIRVFLNTAFPSLPLPDSHFDLISACSVFTHIDETETGWLLELRRILRIGGVACISIHSKETWQDMEQELRNDVVRFRPDIAGEAVLPEGKTVVTFRKDDPYRSQIFHSDQYIERNWGRFFEICEIRPLSLGRQAMVIARRID